MKKIIPLILVLFLFAACGKEAAPAVSPEPQDSPAQAMTEEVTEATTPETEPPTTEAPTDPPTEPGPNTMEIIIGSEIYTMPLRVQELVNNGWEIECYNNYTFEEVNSKHVYFVRDDFSFDADIGGTIGGNVYDSNVVVDTAFFYSGEGAIFAALAGSIFPGMAYGDVLPTLESLGYQDIQIYEKSNGHVVVAYHDEYCMEIHCSEDQVMSLVIM